MSRGKVDKTGRWKAERRAGDPPSVLRLLDRLEAEVEAGTREPPSPTLLERMVYGARLDDGLPTRRMMARLQVLAAECGLTRDDRLALAEVLLRRDCRSWRDLNNREAHLMSAALEGFGYITHLHATRVPS